MDEEGDIDFQVAPKDVKGREVSSCWYLSFAAIKEKKLVTLGIKMPLLNGKNMS